MTTPSDKEELKKLVEQARKLPKPKEDIGEATVKALREATAEPTRTNPTDPDNNPENFPTTQ